MVVIKHTGNRQRAAHRVQSVSERKDKDCDHVDETGTLYNRTRRPDWDDIETQELQRTTWGGSEAGDVEGWPGGEGRE